MDANFNGSNMMGYGKKVVYTAKQQRAYDTGFDKGSNRGFFIGRFIVDEKSSQSRVQAVAEDLKVSNYRKKKRPELVLEIKEKLKTRAKARKTKKTTTLSI